MFELLECPVQCPYCGESITLLIDASVDTQQYIDDCAVCCRPIQVGIHDAESGSPAVDVRTGDE